MNTETVEFTVDQATIIKTLITSQAGSVEKAVAELVVNAADAHATDIAIRLTDDEEGNTQLVVEDNGTGFVDRETVLKCFGQLGFDHTTDEEIARGRSVGKFGLGRGQCLIWGKACWTTNRFEMRVDLEGSKGSPAFDLTEADKVLHEGCRVTVDFYRPLTRFQAAAIEREITKQLKYLPAKVSLNGRTLNKTDVKWTYEDEDFYFLHRPDSSMGVEVHNLGMYVRNYAPSHCRGVSGVLVSKRDTFMVNMARNDILVNVDTLWPKAEAIFKQFADTKRKAKVTDDDREAMVLEQISGKGVTPQEFFTNRAWVDIKGRSASLKMIGSHASNRVTVANRTYSQLGENAHDGKLAFVFHPKVMDWLGVDDPDALIEALNSLHPHAGGRYRVNEKFTYVDFDEVTASFKGASVITPVEKQTVTQSIQLKSLQAVLDGMIARVWGWNAPKRTLRVGKSKQAMAWTDGRTYVAVREHELNYYFANPDAMIRGMHVLLHEVCHDVASGDTHVHGDEFYRRYESACADLGFEWFKQMDGAFQRYHKLRDKAGLSVVGKKYVRNLAVLDAAIDTIEKAGAVEDSLPDVNDDFEEPVESKLAPAASAASQAAAEETQETQAAFGF